MEDGTPPPEPVLVEATCGGKTVPVARTNANGGFILGHGIDADSNAGNAARTGRYNRSAGEAARIRHSSSTALAPGCVLAARLPGFQSGTAPVTDSGAFDLGIVVLRAIPGVDGTTVSATGLLAPKGSRQALEKARAAIGKKKWDAARKLLEKAVTTYPAYAAAWLEMGNVHQGSGDLVNALSAYERSIKADAKYVRPYLQMAAVYRKQQNWRAMADVTATVIKLDPYSYPAAYLLNAIGNMRIGNQEKAEISARKSIAQDTERILPEAEYTLGLILSTRGDMRGAANTYATISDLRRMHLAQKV